MKKTVVALYPTLKQASQAVENLFKAQFTNQNVSLVVTEATRKYEDFTGTDIHAQQRTKETIKDAALGAGTGAVAGGLVGALAATVALVIPVAGPVVVAGPLATILTGAGIGAGVGAVVGGLTGALTDSGVPEEHAQLFTEGVRRGGSLVVVTCDEDRVSKASSILEDEDPVDIEESKKLWAERGWKGFDSKAKPFTPNQINTERSFLRTRRGKTFNDYTNSSSKSRVPTNGRLDSVPTSVETSDISVNEHSNAFTSGQFRTIEPRFKNHYNTAFSNASNDFSYDHVRPAYKLGYALAARSNAAGSNWQTVEPIARKEWASKHGSERSTWDKIKDAVQHGWSEAKEAYNTKDYS